MWHETQHVRWIECQMKYHQTDMLLSVVLKNVARLHGALGGITKPWQIWRSPTCFKDAKHALMFKPWENWVIAIWSLIDLSSKVQMPFNPRKTQSLVAAHLARVAGIKVCKVRTDFRLHQTPSFPAHELKHHSCYALWSHLVIRSVIQVVLILFQIGIIWSVSKF